MPQIRASVIRVQLLKLQHSSTRTNKLGTKAVNLSIYGPYHTNSKKKKVSL